MERVKKMVIFFAFLVTLGLEIEGARNLKDDQKVAFPQDAGDDGSFNWPGFGGSFPWPDLGGLGTGSFPWPNLGGPGTGSFPWPNIGGSGPFPWPGVGGPGSFPWPGLGGPFPWPGGPSSTEGSIGAASPGPTSSATPVTFGNVCTYLPWAPGCAQIRPTDADGPIDEP
ncbi:hypothetical protein NMG60_11032357 [Bertholletia excelsa]